MPHSKWTRYRQLSIRIGTGKEAEAFLERVDKAMKLARRRTRADWLKFVIDLALESAESGSTTPFTVQAPPPPPADAAQDTPPKKRRRNKTGGDAAP